MRKWTIIFKDVNTLTEQVDVYAQNVDVAIKRGLMRNTNWGTFKALENGTVKYVRHKENYRYCRICQRHYHIGWANAYFINKGHKKTEKHIEAEKAQLLQNI
jgi:hypothetical protein